MNQTPTLPWMRISIEAAAIIASILLAFAIDAWWENRRNVSQLNDAYATILDDLRRSKERIGFYRIRTQERSKAIIRLYELANGDTDSIDAEELDRTLSNLQWSVTESVVSLPSIQAMIYSGELASVESDELRSRLASWPTRLEFMKSKFEDDSDNIGNVWFPFLRQFGDVAQIESTITHIPGHPSIQVDPFPLRPAERFDHSTLLDDREFRNILAETWVIVIEILDLYDSAEEWIDESAELIQVEIGNPGN